MFPNGGKESQDAVFRTHVQDWFSLCRNEKFIVAKEILIGTPPHPHRFDLVNGAISVVVECKSLTWTASRNVFNMQRSLCNESVLHLRLLPSNFEKWLVIQKACDPEGKGTFAEYYFRDNRHVLGDVRIAEFDVEKNELRTISCPEQTCVICGMGYTLDQFDQMSEEDFAVFRMQHMPGKLYKYFPNTTINMGGKIVNYSIEALKNNTVFLQSPKRFDDPYDSSIAVDKVEFYRQRIKYYLDICSVQYSFNEDANSLVYKLAQNIYEKSLEGKTLEEIFGITSELEEMDSLRRSVFIFNLAKCLKAYKDDQDAWPHAIYDALHHEFEAMNDFLVNKFRVACFTTSPYSMLMWAHYANSHQGFCIEYEIPDYDAKHAKLLHRLYPVVYSSRRMPVMEYCIRELDVNSMAMDTLWQIHRYGLLAKDILWQYQDEWRLVAYDKTLSLDDTYNCKFFKISRVYLGNKMPFSERQRIIEICRMKNIPYVGVKTNSMQYTMHDCPDDCGCCSYGRIHH